MEGGARADIRRLAAGTILRNLKTLAARIPAARARRGTEPVHDLRVASRRIRAALRLLDRTVAASGARDTKRRRRWRRELKRVTRALGAARDTDVQLECVREFLQKAGRRPHLRPGVERLLLRLRQRRGVEQRDLVVALDRLERSGALREMRREFRKTRAEAERRQPAESATREVVRRLDRMLAYERFLTRPERQKELHEMRIAAKRFRYTMEALSPLFAGGLDAWIRAARKVQADLGDIHDCDVWISQTLPEFLAGERASAELKPGIAAVLRDRRNRRRAAYRAFIRLWKKLRREKTWDQLKKALREAR